MHSDGFVAQRAPLREARRARSRRLLVVTVGVLLAVGVAGCQKGMKVGVYNVCGFAVEAGLEEVGYSQDEWIELNDGEHRGVRTISEHGIEYFVWVRAAEGAAVNEFTVMRDDLSPPPKGNAYDLEIVLEGDRCPAPSDHRDVWPPVHPWD